MKPSLNSESNPLLVFGAHPDDAEFGCGAILCAESAAGRPIHLVVCSRGEAGTHGTPEGRVAEAKAAARIMGASLEFLELDGDAHLAVTAAHAIRLAEVIRRLKPTIVLAPTLVENQHPDHWRLGQLVRDACRLARFGGLAELASLAPHRIAQLCFYAITDGAEPRSAQPILVDVSDPQVIARWRTAMEAHASQVGAMAFVELQLARARVHGLGAGRAYAQPLYPNDALVIGSLAGLGDAARGF
jgi:LmbE family N-acetylglucosaminyl deacetylase